MRSAASTPSSTSWGPARRSKFSRSATSTQARLLKAGGWCVPPTASSPTRCRRWCRLLHGVPTYGIEESVELTTPTGAALVAANAVSYGPMPHMVVEASGFGAGSATLEDRPNLVQIVLGRLASEQNPGQPVTLLETNVDDITGETLRPHRQRAARSRSARRLGDTDRDEERSPRAHRERSGRSCRRRAGRSGPRGRDRVARRTRSNPGALA